MEHESKKEKEDSKGYKEVEGELEGAGKGCTA